MQTKAPWYLIDYYKIIFTNFWPSIETIKILHAFSNKKTRQMDVQLQLSLVEVLVNVNNYHFLIQPLGNDESISVVIIWVHVFVHRGYFFPLLLFVFIVLWGNIVCFWFSE